MITIRISANLLRGLSDVECADPLGGIYSPYPYEARNKYRVAQGAIPEVRSFKNGDVLYLTEGIEWMWYHAWKTQPSLDKSKYWERYMRSNAAFTNLGGIDECHSWVLNRYPTKKPMKYNGVDCPGGNLYRATGSHATDAEGVEWTGVWVLDYDYLKTLTVLAAKELAPRLPPWLLHKARIVHPDGHVTNWDYDFVVPLLTSVGRASIVDGFHVRENWMRTRRLVV